MARGQDAPTQGYTVDPYVAQSLASSKEQSNNRLIAAMQESGAAQRQKSAQTAGFVQQGMQNAQQTQMQAAQSAQEDKRAAENEVARREELEFRRGVEEATQLLQRNALALNQRIQDNLEKGQERDRELEAERDATEFVTRIGLQKVADLGTNAQLTFLSASDMAQTNFEKAVTMATEEKASYEDDVIAAKAIATETASRIRTDKRMDAPIPTDWRERLAERQKRGTLARAGEAIVSGTIRLGKASAAAEAISKEAAEEAAGKMADPLSVLQSELEKNAKGVSVEDIMPRNIHRLEQQIAEGKVTAPDITGAMATLDAMIEEIRERQKGAEAKTERFWKDTEGQLLNARSAILGLQASKTKVAGSNVETVGVRVRSGLAPTDPQFSPSFRAQMKRAAEVNGNDMRAALRSLMKSVEPTSYALIPVEPGDSPALVKAKERWNAPLLQRFPSLKETPAFPED